MTFGNCMVQSRISSNVGRIQGAAVLQKQVDHGDGPDSGGSVQGVLPPLIPDSDGCGWLVLEELSGHIKIIFGCYEMHCCLLPRQSSCTQSITHYCEAQKGGGASQGGEQQQGQVGHITYLSVVIYWERSA